METNLILPMKVMQYFKYRGNYKIKENLRMDKLCLICKRK